MLIPSAATLCRGGLCALILSLFILSGCAPVKIVRLGAPVEHRSSALEEIEAVLADTDTDPGAAAAAAVQIPPLSPKIDRLKKKLAKRAAKHAVVSEASNAIFAVEDEFKKVFDNAKEKIKELEGQANELSLGMIPGQEFSDELKAVVEEAGDVNAQIKALDREFITFSPKSRKARYMMGKSKGKLDRARKALEEAVSEYERKVARAFSATMEEVLVEDIVAEAIDADVILLGEVHSSTAHHRFQLEVIKAFVESGREIAIGMEMFMVDAQEDLDKWVGGELDIEDLRVLYYANWKTPWGQYAPILEYAKEAEIDIVALSIERRAVKKIFVKPPPPPSEEPDAEDGEKSSASIEPAVESEEQEWQGGKLIAEIDAEINAEVEVEMAEVLKIEVEEEILSILMTREEMEAVVCDVEPEYKQMIKDAIGEHADDMNFDLDSFCRIQIVWDTAMALSTKQYIEENPETALVVIAGGMHAWKYGIPTQLKRLSAESVGLLAEARTNFKEAKAVTKAAKTALKEAEEVASKAESVAARALSFSRRFAILEREAAFMGLDEPASGEQGQSDTEIEPIDLEAKADAEAAAAMAKKNAKEAEARFEELEAEYKEARTISREASKELKVLKKSKSEFKCSVVIPEMMEYKRFRSGGASTKDADYLLLH
jgi:uncharacterized iron-regulated protein